MTTAIVTFARGCTFTRAANGAVTVAWDNGNALAAVRGASVDYVSSKAASHLDEATIFLRFVCHKAEIRPFMVGSLCLGL
jgi:uncharacterized protein YkwD